MDVADRELERMVERRSRNGEQDPDERQELWKASVAAHNAHRRGEMRAACCGWHLDQAERHRRTLEDLIRHHEARAEELCEEVWGEGVRS